MTTTADRATDDYRFTTFRTRLMLEDLRFRPTDPGQGDRVPEFDLPTLDGASVGSSSSSAPAPAP